MSVLSYFEKNDIIEVVKEVGLNPEEFEWSDAEMSEQCGAYHNFYSTLVWKKDRTIYCLFCLTGSQRVKYYPNHKGERVHDSFDLPAIRNNEDWKIVLNVVRILWAGPLKKEFDKMWLKNNSSKNSFEDNRFSQMEIH